MRVNYDIAQFFRINVYYKSDFILKRISSWLKQEKNVQCKNVCMSRGGGTSEALKLKLHLNSRVYKTKFFNDIGHQEGGKARSATHEIIRKLNFVYLQKQNLRFNFKKCKRTYIIITIYILQKTFFPNYLRTQCINYKLKSIEIH